MENKLENYRAYIQKLLEEYANLGTPDPDVDRQTIFDTVRDHYQLVYADRLTFR
jgi:XisI protein